MFSAFEAHPALCDAVIELMKVVNRDLNKTSSKPAARRMFYSLSVKLLCTAVSLCCQQIKQLCVVNTESHLAQNVYLFCDQQ